VSDLNDLVQWLTACTDGDEQWADRHHQAESATRFGGHPGRLRREVVRNRRILKRHRPSPPAKAKWLAEPLCQHCFEWDYGRNFDHPVWPCDEVRDLVSIYIDRPGYRAEWGPTSE
jgi:hypothetical protein